MQSVCISRSPNRSIHVAGNRQLAAPTVCVDSRNALYLRKAQAINHVPRQSQHPRARVRHRPYRLSPHSPLVNPAPKRVNPVLEILQLNLNDNLAHNSLQTPLSRSPSYNHSHTRSGDSGLGPSARFIGSGIKRITTVTTETRNTFDNLPPLREAE